MLVAKDGAPPGAADVSAASVKHLDSFWNVVVEGGLLASPSHERKFLALRLFQVRTPAALVD